MKNIMTRIIVIVIAYCHIFTLGSPIYTVSAANEDEQNDMQSKMDTIQALIDSASQAKMEEDFEAVEYYETLLIKLGVEHVETENIVDHLATDGISLPSDSTTSTQAVPTLPNRPNVDWYTCEFPDYYVPERGEYYDIYMIVATPKNSNSWLRRTEYIYPTNTADVVFSNFASECGDAILKAGAEAAQLDKLFSVLSFVTGLLDGVTIYDVSEARIGSWRLLYTIDASFQYMYVRESGTSEYVFSMGASKMKSNYAYIAPVELYFEDNRSEMETVTYNVSNHVVSGSNYGSLKVAANAFYNNSVAYSTISRFLVSLFPDDPTRTQNVWLECPGWPNLITAINSSSDPNEDIA